MTNCTKCGSEVPNEAKFCDNCGTPVSTATPKQNVEQQPTPQHNMQGYGNANGQPPMQNNIQQQPNMYSQSTPNMQQHNMYQQPNMHQQSNMYQQPNMQQMPNQQGYGNMPLSGNTMPGYNNVNTATKSNNNKVFIFGGIAIAVIAVILIAVFLLGGSSNDPNIGVWNASEVNMMGMSIDVNDLYSNGMTLELKSGGNCTLKIDEEEYNAKWELDGTTFILSDSGDEFTGTLDGDVLEITNLLDMGLDIVFVRDGASINDNAVDNNPDEAMPTPDETIPSENDNTNGTAPTPEVDTDQELMEVKLTSPSDWFGTMTISNYSGDNDLTGTYDVWAYIDENENGYYFEMFADGPYDDENSIIVMSFYIELHDYTFFPIVNEDAWTYNYAPLKEEDNTWYAPQNFSGNLYASYDYNYEGETFTLEYDISKIS